MLAGAPVEVGVTMWVSSVSSISEVDMVRLLLNSAVVGICGQRYASCRGDGAFLRNVRAAVDTK